MKLKMEILHFFPQEHLLSIFDNMASVLFDAKAADNIIEGFSKEKERLVFLKPVLAKGAREVVVVFDVAVIVVLVVLVFVAVLVVVFDLVVGDGDEAVIPFHDVLDIVADFVDIDSALIPCCFCCSHFCCGWSYFCRYYRGTPQ